MLTPTTNGSNDGIAFELVYEKETLDVLNTQATGSTEADPELEWARALENEISLLFNANRW